MSDRKSHRRRPRRRPRRTARDTRPNIVSWRDRDGIPWAWIAGPMPADLDRRF